MAYNGRMRTEKVIKYFGSKTKLARAIGIGKQSVQKWKEIVPFPRQQQIEELTQGKLKAMSWSQYLRARESA
jgi:hypothetical protein